VHTVHVIFVSARRRKEAIPGASLTDGNAAMVEIAGAVFVRSRQTNLKSSL